MSIESEKAPVAVLHAPAATPGLHHITAITRDARANVRFYTDLLGLRLVKRTVNFDDPTAYHLYYGDGAGTPGTILTFFAWQHGRAGQRGLGQAGEIAFRIPRASLGWWTQRLINKGVAFDAPEKQFGETVLGFRDPDGIRIELVATMAGETPGGWTAGSVPAEHAIRGFHGVTLWLGDTAGTAALLTNVLGYAGVGAEGARSRYQAASGAIAAIIDLRSAPGFLAGQMGTGTIHHIAFRANDDAAQARMVAALAEIGVRSTDQLDRNYFRSVYFREPGGVIFEIATDEPGFTVDEDLQELGTALKLPAWYEGRRAVIEAALPALV
jgi:glyoxalase family protein